VKIVIPGGSGQVGTILARHFHAAGHKVTVLSRRPCAAPWRTVSWDGIAPGAWTSELEASDVCINLAGRSVNCRYHAANRRAIRSAMTFSPDRGGVFDALLGLVRFGVGGPQGPGTQFVSWIHEIDFCRAIDFLIARRDIAGVVNLASPNPLPNRDFLRSLREAWGARIGLPIPHWALEIGAMLRRTESELVLRSRRVVPGRLLAEGFRFQFPDWPEAARELVARWRH